MQPSDRSGPDAPPAVKPGLRNLPRAVWMLGVTSLCTDTASEAVYPLLPIYLTRVLGAGAVSLGIIEGVAEATSSLLKILSGQLSDRWKIRRPIVIAGYGLSSAVRPLTALVSSWTQLLGVRFADRVGKGVRSAPRDAILAACATPSNRGLVFGFHRAMDHAGAVLGPVLASLFLLAWPGRYRLLFALTIVPGALAVASLFLVTEPASPPPARPADATPLHDGASSWRRLPARFTAFLVVLLVFALGNSADAFLLLRLTDLGISAALIPLLWAALHVVKAATSVWGGGLSDRLGRRGVIGAGWLIYAAVYLGFATTVSASTLIGLVLLYGFYYGLSEGTEKAMVADLAPAALRGTAFGIYNAATGFGSLGASLVFGLVWKSVGPSAAFTMGAVLALLATLLLALFVKER